MSNSTRRQKAIFHLPGLFEFYELYHEFLPLYENCREYFFDDVEIGSIYGAPGDCLWGGGRVGYGDNTSEEVLALVRRYGITPRLTFSNSLLTEEHLKDRRCNELCRIFAETEGSAGDAADAQKSETNKTGLRFTSPAGIIVHSDLLLNYLKKTYPSLHFISSTTKVLTDFGDFERELARDEFAYVVPDFRLNKAFERLEGLAQTAKDKVEFLCNECCYIGCTDRRACYENVSRKNLGEDCPEHICRQPGGKEGYRFSEAMKNPAFIGNEDIREKYLPMGFSNFKIEGRSLGSAVVLEMLLYYLVKPEYHLHVREKIYLDSMLDLF